MRLRGAALNSLSPLACLLVLAQPATAFGEYRRVCDMPWSVDFSGTIQDYGSDCLLVDDQSPFVIHLQDSYRRMPVDGRPIDDADCPSGSPRAVVGGRTPRCGRPVGPERE